MKQFSQNLMVKLINSEVRLEKSNRTAIRFTPLALVWGATSSAKSFPEARS
ncbi:hypothetical protein [Hoeflea sp. 108]|uniref:hypothetical protein n=1 Tax=Hoeflea sp. 108 TaxID=1116369 RepID=UPI0012FCA9D7|nr:hypothetical protein [Hoeflea sp. 108]